MTGGADRSLSGTPPPRPIPLKDRASIVFVERGHLDVIDGAFVLVDAGGVRTHIPVGGLTCIMLEPGTRASHAAVVLAARAGTLLLWVGEAGVRLYAAGQPGGARADKLLWQCRMALDPDARLAIVRRMFQMRFGEQAPSEAAVLAAGYAPAVGFLHSGKPLSFVYDIADLYKFETVVPEAFRIAGLHAKGKLHGLDPAASNDAGFDFETTGINRRMPVSFDGLKLVAFRPENPFK